MHFSTPTCAASHMTQPRILPTTIARRLGCTCIVHCCVLSCTPLMMVNMHPAQPFSRLARLFLLSCSCSYPVGMRNDHHGGRAPLWSPEASAIIHHLAEII